jgi:hypothetical protein
LNTRIYTEKPIRYDGSQLNPHWIYQNFDLSDHALVAFTGPADVTIEHMVDLEDVKKKAPIYSPEMLHFIGEWFQDSFEVGILLQHLFVGEIYEALLERGAAGWLRRGNDIYYDRRKLSVSICTRSAVSTLMHVGINVRTDGTPVPTAGLTELGIEPFAFAQQVVERFLADQIIWRKARVKVQPR